MKHAFPPPGRVSALLGAAVLSLLEPASSDAAPAWWSEPVTSIAGDTPVNDWAAANLGQLKHVATQAKAHLDFTLSSIGGAGPEIDAMCQFTQQDNYAPAAVGQLKNVAKVFYDRLAQAQWNWQTGYPGTATTPYPWTGTVHAENAAPINIGQLKNAFSFDLSSWASFDQDADSMADGWEVYYGLNPGNSADGDLDWDNDGLTNREEYNANANPLTADTDGDFSPDAEEVEEGTDPRRDTSAPVTLCAVYDSVHWLMDYLPPANPQPWETSHPIWYEYFQRWDGQAAAIRPGGRGGPLYDPPGSLSGQASLIDTAATLTAWNVRWDHTTVLRSEAEFRSDGEGSARTSAARLWLRGPKSSSPVTRTFVKLVRREVPPVPPLSGITEEYSTVTFTIPANQNHSAPQSFTAVLSPAEPARSHIERTNISLLPSELKQENMANFEVADNTTDMASSYSTATISSDGVAYITGEPAMPQLKASFPGLPANINIEWKLEIKTERTERGTKDDRNYPASGYKTLPGNQEWDIGAEFGTDFVGGKCKLFYKAGGAAEQTLEFFIRGKNPRDADARAYVTTHPKSATYPYAWALVQHESRQGNRCYNQFNSGGDGPGNLERPNFGPPDGWGIAQLDKPIGVSASTMEVYQWKKNVDKFFDELDEKEAATNRFFNAVAQAYPNDPDAANPPASYTVTGTNTAYSARQLSTMILYNGAGGTQSSTLNGNMYRNPWKFNPSGNPKWTFQDNQEDYAFDVIHGEVDETFQVTE